MFTHVVGADLDAASVVEPADEGFSADAVGRDFNPAGGGGLGGNDRREPSVALDNDLGQVILSALVDADGQEILGPSTNNHHVQLCASQPSDGKRSERLSWFSYNPTRWVAACHWG